MTRIAAALLGMVSVFANATEPFDFKGARLGMPLAAFKQTLFPDRGIGSEDALSNPKCTDDAERDLGLVGHLSISASDKALGVTECRWFRPLRSASAYVAPRWEPAFLNVAGYTTPAVRYRFIKTPDSTAPLLYEISIQMPSAVFGAANSGLTERFGEPSSTETREVKNRLGNTFTNAIATWDNGSSSIRLEERYTRVDEMGLIYRHTALYGRYTAERRKLEGTPGGRL